MTADWAGAQLGEDGNTYQVEDSASLRAAAAAIAQQATRTVDILSRDLDAPVYDNDEFLDAIRRLAISSPRAHVRVLVHDSTPAVRSGHRLIELARRLTSRIGIRVVPEEKRSEPAAYLIADARAVVHRAYGERPEATLCFNAPRKARSLLHDFDATWEVSEPDPELRRLHL
jgi:hypothetical protein